MPITVEFAGNNDPRLERCVQILDIYMEAYSDAYKSTPWLAMKYLRTLPCYEWLDSVNAHILLEEYVDFDMDAMVIVCYAMLDEQHRVLHSLTSDELVPTRWESARTDAGPGSWDIP